MYVTLLTSYHYATCLLPGQKLGQKVKHTALFQKLIN